jgi:type II secretory ATPase GspE/PulE/Tfp pilus assembly ATPase PilB-like protein
MTALDIKRIAMANGMQTLRQSAWKKVYRGISTIDELIEASGSDEDTRTPAGQDQRSA